MEGLSFQQFINLFLVLISWLLIIFLVSTKTKNKTSNILLALYLLTNAQDSSGLFASYFIYPDYPGWGMFINNSVFLKFPLLYLYLLSVIYSDFKLKLKHLWHLWAYVINFMILWPDYFSVDFESKWAFLIAKVEGQEPMAIKLSYALIHVQSFFYIVMCFIEIKKYKQLLLENYADAKLMLHQWLFQFITLIAVSMVISTVKNVLLFMHSDIIFFYINWIVQVLALFIICWMVIKALHSPELFRGIESKLQLVKHMVKNQESTETLATTDSEVITTLKTYMHDEKPYMNPNLTIYKLAEELNMPTKDLSLLINHDMNQHFFDFVNEYRIKKAMDILQDPDQQELTVLEILYEVGFNSKSSFNTSFKKYTGKTPTEYRKNYLKSAS